MANQEIFILFWGKGEFHKNAEWNMQGAAVFATYELALDEIHESVDLTTPYHESRVQEGSYNDGMVHYFNVSSPGADKVWRVQNHWIILRTLIQGTNDG